MNYRYIKFPATIGVMLIALLGSLALIGFSFINPWMLEEVLVLTFQRDCSLYWQFCWLVG